MSASSENGCSSELKKTYNAEKGVKVFAEDAFTPNGDMNNDDFLPKELKDSYVEFNVVVSDMNGKMVFETQDKYQAWNGGLNNNGNILPAGQYQVVGMRVQGTNLVAARLVFQGFPWRPGAPAVNVLGDEDNKYFRMGRMGIWGEFDQTSPPTMDCLGVTDTTQVVYLDLIKVG